MVVIELQKETKEVLNNTLLEATSKGDLKEVMRCLDLGADVNTRITWDNSILLETDKEQTDLEDYRLVGGTPLIWAAGEGHAKVVEALLENEKADVNAKDIGVQTALIWAAKGGHADVVKVLLESGKIDVNAQDEYGDTAIVKAAREGHSQVVKQLLENKEVNIHITDYKGKSALVWAAKRGYPDIIDLLAERGADLNDIKKYRHNVFGYHFPEFIDTFRSLKKTFATTIKKK
ncbi:MAG: ankyrin repeat domain-containing protein [Candidatus Margulisiibacteriota bacterium]